MAVEKTLRLESTKRFPLFHRHDDGIIPKVCGGENKTKPLSNGVSENLVAIMRPCDRGIYQDRYARIIIECPESDSLHQEAGYIYAD